MLLLIGAFLAGILTVFAPCVFALLPVIVGGSMSGDVHDKRRPVIITLSLALSLILFTVLFKATTLFIDVSPSVITSFSGGIIIALGIVLLFPVIYERIILKLNLQVTSQRLLGQGYGKGAIVGAVITGAALGPVFSSCSPVYGYILATVLPVDFATAMAAMVAYVLGLSVMLLAVGYVGQRLVRRLSWASNPRGWFQRIVAVGFVIVGLLIITGYDKQFQVYVAEHTPFDFDGLSAKLIPTKASESLPGLFNVAPRPAPELTGISTWINSQPLTLASLKGKVVLVDFWTYSCINCIRTQPYLKAWHQTYKDSGLVIIGVHAPEFSFEKNPDNVRQAVKAAGLEYPIAMDNDLRTWAAFDNQYWPASYLIDREGQLRRTHFGEGEYKEEEQAIRALLSDKAGVNLPGSSSLTESSAVGDTTPETYLGSRRAGGYTGQPGLTEGSHEFQPAELKRVNQWTLGGTWRVESEGITAVKDSVLRFRVAARDVYLVTGSNAKGTITVKFDGQPISQTGSAGSDVKDSRLDVSMAQLYRLAHFDTLKPDATLELQVPAGVQLNTFTFGG